MKRLLYIALSGVIMASTCVAPMRASNDITPVETSFFDSLQETNWIQKGMAVGVLATLAGYACAVSSYGAAKVNAVVAGSIAGISGLALGIALTESNAIMHAAELLQVPLCSVSGHSVSGFALIAAIGLGALVYTTVYDYLDTGKSVTTKSTISMKRS